MARKRDIESLVDGCVIREETECYRLPWVGPKPTPEQTNEMLTSGEIYTPYIPMSIDHNNPVGSEWSCPFCTAINPTTKYKCLNCGAAKEKVEAKNEKTKAQKIYAIDHDFVNRED